MSEQFVVLVKTGPSFLKVTAHGPHQTAGEAKFWMNRFEAPAGEGPVAVEMLKLAPPSEVTFDDLPVGQTFNVLISFGTDTKVLRKVGPEEAEYTEDLVFKNALYGGTQDLVHEFKGKKVNLPPDTKVRPV